MRIVSRFSLISIGCIGCSLRNRESDVVITSTKHVHHHQRLTSTELIDRQTDQALPAKMTDRSMGIFLYPHRFDALEKSYGPLQSLMALVQSRIPSVAQNSTP